GTVRLLAAFEPLVVDGSAAVCFSSSSAYMIPLELLGAEAAALVNESRSADFLDRVEKIITDSGLAYGGSKKGVQLEAARAAVRWGPLGGRVTSLAPPLIDTPVEPPQVHHQ